MSNPTSPNFDPWFIAFAQVFLDKVWDWGSRKIGDANQRNAKRILWKNALEMAVHDSQLILQGTPAFLALQSAAQLQGMSAIAASSASDFLDVNAFAKNTTQEIMLRFRLESIDAPSQPHLEQGIHTVIKKFQKHLFDGDEGFRTLLAQTATIATFDVQKEIRDGINTIADSLMPAQAENFPEYQFRDSILREFNMPTFAGIVDSNSSDAPQGEVAMSVLNLFIDLEAKREFEVRTGPSLVVIANNGLISSTDENGEADDDSKSQSGTGQKETKQQAIRETETKSVFEFLGAHRSLVVRGGPGAGKSTLLRYLLALSANRHLDSNLQQSTTTTSDAPLPIMIPVREYVRGVHGNLLDFVAHRTCHIGQINHPPQHLKPGIEKALQDGRCLVCFDGLDEIATDEQGQMIRTAITQWRNQYPENRFVITTRVAGYPSVRLDPALFKLIDLLELDDNRVMAFLEHWFKIHEINQQQQLEKRTGLWEALKNQPTILKMARNPLLLTIIAVVYRKGTHLPSQRVRLYERCVELLLESWANNRGQPLTESEKQRPYQIMLEPILHELSYQMQVQANSNEERLTINRDRMLAEVQNFLFKDPNTEAQGKRQVAQNEAESFVEFIEKRVGLLNDDGADTFAFVHPSFQEYFCARRLYENRFDFPVWSEIQPHLYDAKWREIILLTIGIPKPGDKESLPSKLLEDIRKAGEEDALEEFTHRHLDLRFAAIADLIAATPESRHRVLEAVFDRIQTDTEVGHSERFSLLSRFRGVPFVIDRLSDLAQNPVAHGQDRVEAARMLLVLGEGELAIQLLVLLGCDSAVHAFSQTIAARILFGVGKKVHAIEILNRITRDSDSYDESYFSAARTLFDLGEKGAAIESLLRTARAENIDVFTRIDALEALFPLGEENTAIDLMLVFLFDSSLDVDGRSSALEVLGRLARTSERFIKKLLDLSQDVTVDEVLRKEAAASLMALGHQTQAVETFLSLALDPKATISTRQSAIQHLSKTKSVPILDSLRTISRDPNDSIKISVARAFIELGEHELARPTLLGFSSEPNPINIRLNAAKGLVKLGDTLTAIDLLLKIVHTNGVENSTFMTAIQELIDLGEESQAEEILLKFADDPNCNENLLASICYRLLALDQREKAMKLALQIIRNSQVGEGTVRRTVRLLIRIGDTSPVVITSLLHLAQKPAITQALRRDVKQVLSRLSLESPPMPKSGVA